MRPFAQTGLFLALLFFVTGCAAGISREELLKEMQEGRTPLIVDVRSQGEYDRDHVPGAVHVPFTSISSGLESMGARPDERIVLYCEHGPRAGIAYWSLSLSGYRNVYSLEGHMKGWRNSQFPIETISHGP
jgi:rhodanese-related sulfurtransferase